MEEQKQKTLIKRIEREGFIVFKPDKKHKTYSVGCYFSEILSGKLVKASRYQVELNKMMIKR